MFPISTVLSGFRLEERTELKQQYLREALMAVETAEGAASAPAAAQIQAVMTGLTKQLRKYIDEHPREKLTKEMTLIHMAANSLLNRE